MATFAFSASIILPIFVIVFCSVLRSSTVVLSVGPFEPGDSGDWLSACVALSKSAADPLAAHKCAQFYQLLASEYFKNLRT